MLRPTSPNISIITNFGCESNCWYCIWKNHKLKDINEKTDWNKLEKFISDNQSKGKFSISGGRDCLYDYYNLPTWWYSIFNLAKKYNMKIDIHTRKKFINYEFWRRINRCVFSSDSLSNDITYLEYLIPLTKIRITHVVTSNSTNNIIDQYLEFQKQTNCQFTIKQLIGYNDNNRYEKIRNKYPNIFYLDKGDYNIYYMPDNNIYETFLI